MATLVHVGSASGRAAAAYANAGAALAALDETQPFACGDVGQISEPGLVVLEGPERVVALGFDAHLALADARKATLLAGDVEAPLDRPDALARLAWSCLNTATVVALDAAAWQTVQLLPFARRRFHPMPPLRLDDGEDDGRVLVIDHGEPAAACALAALLRQHLPGVATAEPAGTDGPAWSGRGTIHVHVGRHDAASTRLRLLDSWHSGRPVLHLLPSGDRARIGPTDGLQVEDGVNGFDCATPEAVLARLCELLPNRALRRTLVAAGHRSAAPLARGWTDVARDLLS